MSTVELDDFMAFNDQLLALIEAGVPVGAGQEVPDRDLPAMLTRINAMVARQAHRGGAVVEAIESGERIPEWYRNLVVTGLRSGSLDTTLREFSHVASSADESRYVSESALIYPLIVCGLAYLGLIGCCLFFIPRMEAAYTTLRLNPGSGLLLLQTIRDTLPIWIAVPPLLLLIGMLLRSRRRALAKPVGGPMSRFLAAASGGAQAARQQQCAHFAETMASLEAGHVPVGKALGIAASGCSDDTLANGARSLAETAESGMPIDADNPEAQKFPPFLRWAILQSEGTVGRERAMHMAAVLYRDGANYSLRRAKIIAPIIGVVVLAGGVTLMYGITLFLPVAQMLKTVASSH